MKTPLYQVDAFSGRLFAGNPAAVCPLEGWLPDATLQAIAAENNLAETAFFVRGADGYDLRWFTPLVEMDLCGHATVASAFIVFRFLDPRADSVTFHSRSGPLQVRRAGDRLAMTLPRRPGTPCEAPPRLAAALGRPPIEVLRSRDYLAIYENEAAVRALRPDMAGIASLDALGVIVSAPGDASDFVSRFFAPAAGVPEDPVTGSAHCTLVPYWAKKLGKTRLHALQVSARGGDLMCEDGETTVTLAGQAVLYLEGTIEVP